MTDAYQPLEPKVLFKLLTIWSRQQSRNSQYLICNNIKHKNQTKTTVWYPQLNNYSITKTVINLLSKY